MTPTVFKTAAAAFLLSSSGIALAQDAAMTSAVYEPATVEAKFEKFRPQSGADSTAIDFEVWGEALSYFVFPMGQSIRESAPSVSPEMGSRRIYGHESRYRLEGNRVIFSYLDDEVKALLSEYRLDLQSTGDKVDISKLGRNEQLAFWMNLHNVAIIEQIAKEYPVSQPSRIKLGESKMPMDETPFITVAGVSMSPKDIRTQIVYPNWSDPKVIYGFFRGDIGGPSIQRKAFDGSNVSELLEDSAIEFINSLRGTQKNGSKLDVSKIYAEAAPFFFKNWESDMRQHLLTYSKKDVSAFIEKTSETRPRIYENDVADLANGERDPNYGFVVQGDNVKGFGVPSAIRRLLVEHNQKTEKIIKRSDIEGRVTVINVGDLTKPRSENEEVE